MTTETTNAASLPLCVFCIKGTCEAEFRDRGGCPCECHVPPSRRTGAGMAQGQWGGHHEGQVYTLGVWYEDGGKRFRLFEPPRYVAGSHGRWVGPALLEDGRVCVVEWGPNTRRAGLVRSAVRRVAPELVDRLEAAAQRIQRALR